MKMPYILNVQRFCLEDGPGIRTTVFVKGCPLKCKWCHNPESQSLKPQLWYRNENCIQCGNCTFICKQGVHSIKDGIHIVDSKKCIQCGQCIDACNKNALGIYGKSISLDEIMEIVSQDQVFYGTQGGLTISGGEPLLYPEFCIELCKRAKEAKIKVAIETSGFADNKSVKVLSEYIDYWLVDYKAGTVQKHKKLCGVSNELIHKNIKFLLSNHQNVCIRYPVVSMMNDSEEDEQILQELIKDAVYTVKIEKLPYHNMGVSKAKLIGVEQEDYTVNEFPVKNEII